MDHGIWRRVQLVPFNVVLKDYEIDRDLPKKLEIELPGILTWAVQGCLEWQKQGLSVPDEVKYATKEYREESDVISRFIKDRCTKDKDSKISIKNLYDIYSAWSEENTDDTVSKKTFGHFLKQRGVRQMKNNGCRYWVGLKLNTTEKTTENTTDACFQGLTEPIAEVCQTIQ